MQVGDEVQRVPRTGRTRTRASASSASTAACHGVRDIATLRRATGGDRGTGGAEAPASGRGGRRSTDYPATSKNIAAPRAANGNAWTRCPGARSREASRRAVAPAWGHAGCEVARSGRHSNVRRGLAPAGHRCHEGASTDEDIGGSDRDAAARHDVLDVPGSFMTVGGGSRSRWWLVPGANRRGRAVGCAPHRRGTGSGRRRAVARLDGARRDVPGAWHVQDIACSVSRAHGAPGDVLPHARHRPRHTAFAAPYTGPDARSTPGRRPGATGSGPGAGRRRRRLRNGQRGCGRPTAGASSRRGQRPAGPATLTPGTYCWSSRNADGTGQAVCADGSPPTCETAPRLAASDGDAVRVRLGFTPAAAELTLGSGEPAAVAAGRDLVLPLGSFTGVAMLTAHRGGDDVIYGICVVRG